MKNWVVITGATGSMGRVAVKAMASEGYPVVMACRNPDKAHEVRRQVMNDCPDAVVEIHSLDLMSQASVRTFVAGLEGRKIAALFNNAGVIARSYNLTEDGYEQSMAVNYLNPALLTTLLIPSFEKGGRVVNMVSLTTKLARLDMDWQDRKPESFSRLSFYSSSKLAFLYFSIALARRYPELVVNVSDPGIVDSNMISMGKWFDPLADIFFRPFINSPEKGVAPALKALHADSSLHYYVGKSAKPIPARFVSSPMVDSLSAQLLNLL